MDVSLIDTAPLETRQRWFAEMNAWQTPEDFPVDLPEFNGDHNAQYEDPTWRTAFNAVTSSLTAAEMSLGWWLHRLGRTEAEWSEWWSSRGRP